MSDSDLPLELGMLTIPDLCPFKAGNAGVGFFRAELGRSGCISFRPPALCSLLVINEASLPATATFEGERV